MEPEALSLLHGWLSAEDPLVWREVAARCLLLRLVVEQSPTVGGEDLGGMGVEQDLLRDPDDAPGVGEVAEEETCAKVFPLEKKQENGDEMIGVLVNAAPEGFSWGLTRCLSLLLVNFF